MADPARITLLTDFGTVDGYVAAMKGVLARAAPEARLDDASHDLPQGDVRAAAWALHRYWRLYPEGTVHLVVVDPGVGTERRALAIRADGRLLVVPDNGVATLVLERAASWEAVEIVPFDPLHGGASTTFHGRDLFAPVAGRLAAGAPLGELGSPVGDPRRLDLPAPSESPGGSMAGEVVHVDRFGNLATNLPGDRVRSAAGRGTATVARVGIAGRELSVEVTYASVGVGELVAVVNSDGLVEVAVRDGSAADRLGVGLGEPATLQL